MASALLLAAAPAIAEPLRVGVLAFRGVEEAVGRWTATADYLTRAVPEHEFVLVPLSLEGVSAAVRDGHVDFLLTNPGNYVQLAAPLALAKVATLKTDGFNGVPTGNRFGAVIFVHADRGDIATLADLKGKTLAAVAPQAFGGFQMAWRELKDQGLDPFHDLAAIKFMGFPQDAILRAVLKGEVDAGTFRTGNIEAMARAGALEPGRIRILSARQEPGFGYLLSTRLYPEWVLAAPPNTALPLREQVALALLAMPSEAEAARRGRYVGWTTPMNDEPIVELFQSIGVLTAPARGMRWSWLVVAAMAGLACGAILVALWQRRYQTSPARALGDARAHALVARLTQREREVLMLVMAGEPNKRIAHLLDISEKTVEYHRANLMRKLEVRNTAALVRTATLAGFPPAAAAPQGNP